MTMTSDQLATAAADHLWLHFSRLSGEGDAPLTVIERGEGAYVWDSHGNRYLDGLAGLFVVQAGHGRQEMADAAGSQAAKLGYFPLWTYAHPTAIELAARLAELAPGDPQPGVLHHRRRRGGRVGVEAGPPVLPHHRPAGAGEGDQPPDRLPRRHPRGAQHHGPRRHQGAVPAPAQRPGAPRAQHADGAAGQPRRPPCRRRRHRGHDRRGGPGDGGRRLPRAGAERRWLPGAAARLLPAGAGDLRPPRRAARERRGDLRLRPARCLVRVVAPRLPARHDHLRQGGHLGLRPAGRRDGVGPHRRAVPRATAPRSSTASPSPATP